MQVQTNVTYKEPTTGAGIPMTVPDDIPIVTEPSETFLHPRQVIDYRSEREDCLEWLLAFGKDPDKAEGYARGTVDPRSRRMDQFYRWVWQQEGGYTANVTHEHADAWMRELAQEDYSSAHKSDCQKSIQMLFKWIAHERGGSEWDPEITFTDSDASNPRDYLTREERSKVRDAALEYGSIPTYSNMAPAERDRWKRHLAQRFEKPKSAVTPDDWKRANSWKIPSLVWTSLDAGLRPIEVERATVSWIDTDNKVLRIPKRESSKSYDNWTVSIRDRTASYLERWLDEREYYDKYDQTDTVWLTRESNPYDSSALGYIIGKLCNIAGIDTEHREMSWYSIRHSVGTYMTREEDLAAAQAQLRHKSPETTMKYDQTPVEDRRDALDRMG